MKIIPSFEINERTTKSLRCLIRNPDDDPDFTINSVRPFVFLSGRIEPPVYINGRNGTDSTGLTLIDNANGVWEINFKMDPEDNIIFNRSLYAKSGYERHTVIFEINYGMGDIYFQEIELLIKDLPIVS